MPDKKNKLQSQKDNPCQAFESGEPKEVGHTRGHPITARPKNHKDKPGEEDWESGRHDAVE